MAETTETAEAPAVPEFGSVEDAERALDVVTSRINGTKGRLEALYDERRGIFRFLLTAGVSQAAVARRAGVAPMAVNFAVYGPAKKGGKKAAGE